LTALALASRHGHAECVRLLLDGGARKEAKAEDGSTALIHATNKGHTDCVRLLVDGGADKEAKNAEGLTALMCAACESRVDCARLLLDRGANKEVRAHNGLTALMIATFQGHVDCVRLLLVGGANKDIKDKSGSTALDMALKSGKSAVARLIASHSGAECCDMAQMDPKRRAKFMGRSCYNCFKTQPDTLQKCGLCKVAQYCSKECQLTNWPRHKTTCDRGGALRRQASSQQCQDEVEETSVSPVQQHDNERVSAPAPESNVAACHFCAKSQAHVAARLKLCNRCRSVSYCSVECQRSDWSAHKKVCAKPGE
jgi:hypothetical protein